MAENATVPRGGGPAGGLRKGTAAQAPVCSRCSFKFGRPLPLPAAGNYTFLSEVLVRGEQVRPDARTCVGILKSHKVDFPFSAAPVAVTAHGARMPFPPRHDNEIKRAGGGL